MAECPIVVTDSGLQDNDPCSGSLCWPWYVQSWQDAAKREYEIALKLTDIFTNEERNALANAGLELQEILKRTGLNLIAIWNTFNLREIIQKLATIAKALRCLWFGAAQRKQGDPPPVQKLPSNTPTAQKEEAQRSWWESWLPSLASWSPKLSWPKLPGFEVAADAIWEKLKSWFMKILPWIIIAAILYFSWPYLTKAAVGYGKKKAVDYARKRLS